VTKSDGERQRAEELAEESRRQALRAAGNAAAASRASADVHESAAQLHNHLAEIGIGDVDEHRRQAQQHRDAAGADRVEAQYDDQLRERFERGASDAD
jgi:hypothetical protein